MTSSHRNLRKAAVLVSSLEADEAEALLRQMSPAQAHVLRQAVDYLGKIDPAEQDDVIEEFFRVGPLLPDGDPAGIELDAPLPLSLGGPIPREPQPPGTEQEKAPFRFLYEAPPHKLAPFLEREHPQTIAVVISHLPADRAAEVLTHLGPELQIEVARRLVDLEEADPEVLHEVERGLESWLCAQIGGQRRQAAGVTALASILSAANPRARQHILSNLARHDRQLADRLEVPAAPRLSFADLEHLDSPSLTAILRQAEVDILPLALAGASPQFAEQALSLLDDEAAQTVRQALCNLGPTRLSDVEEAQRHLVETARVLDKRGEIALRGRGLLSVAV